MYFDLLLLFLICLSALFGYIHGFVRQLISLISMFAILLFAAPLAHWLKVGSGWHWFKEAPEFVLFGTASFAIVLLFLGISGIVFLIRKGAGPSPTDRWIGCGIGALKGFVFGLLVSFGVHLLPEHAKTRFDELNADIQDSYFMKMSEPMLDWKSLEALKRLKEIKEQLKTPHPFGIPRTESGSGPWAQDDGVEDE